MDVHVTLLVFPPTATAKPYYYFISGLGIMAIPNLMVLILSLHNQWPKAIHEGNGTVLLLITNRASEEQRKAIRQIVYGQAKGECFALFAGTFSRFLEPQSVDINAKIDGRKSSFSVTGLVNVEVESFKNPVTGEEQDTKIQLPKGIVWKLADAAKTRIMRITSPDLNYDHSGKNAFYSVVEFKGP
jgi:hypothetical protein